MVRWLSMHLALRGIIHWRLVMLRQLLMLRLVSLMWLVCLVRLVHKVRLVMRMMLVMRAVMRLRSLMRHWIHRRRTVNVLSVKRPVEHWAPQYCGVNISSFGIRWTAHLATVSL